MGVLEKFKIVNRFSYSPDIMGARKFDAVSILTVYDSLATLLLTYPAVDFGITLAV